MKKNAKSVIVGKATLKVTTVGIASTAFVSRGMAFNKALTAKQPQTLTAGLGRRSFLLGPPAARLASFQSVRGWPGEIPISANARLFPRRRHLARLQFPHQERVRVQY